MMKSEIATSAALGLKLTIVVLDDRDFGYVNRLQRATGGESFNDLPHDPAHEVPAPIDFAAHARSLGTTAEHVQGITALADALACARAARSTYVVAVDTDPMATTELRGACWDVVVPEVSERAVVRDGRARYVHAGRDQSIG
jgi:3D-(3,5/4)-trihydroxycyclohexane-1,2-dione acylhydrolase (decyclizing)